MNEHPQQTKAAWEDANNQLEKVRKMNDDEIRRRKNYLKQPTKGGARIGAGRKPRETPREAITVRIEPQDAAKLRDLCAAREMSQADWIAEKIRRSRL